MSRQMIYDAAIKHEKKEEAINTAIKITAQSVFADLTAFYISIGNAQQYGTLDQAKVDAQYNALYKKWVQE